MAGRGVHRDEAFDEQFAKLVPNVAARDQIMAGLRDTIGVEPTTGIRLNEEERPDSVWSVQIPEARGWGVPALTLLYTFDDEQIRYHWIDRT